MRIGPVLRSSRFLRNAPGVAAYSLLDRSLDLFFEPTRLFAGLRREPRIADALALSTALCAGFAALSLWLAHRDRAFARLGLEVPLAAQAGFVALAAAWLWLYVAVAALVGLAFSGFVVRDVPYRHWLALAAHVSLVAAALIPVEFAAAALGGWPEPSLSLALLADAPEHSATEAFLSRVSLRSVVFLVVFSAGAAAFTGSAWRTAAGFQLGAWSLLWLMLSWLGSRGA